VCVCVCVCVCVYITSYRRPVLDFPATAKYPD